MSELVLAATKGSKKSMVTLFEANKNKVYGLALLLLKNEEQAAEITIEAFNKSWSQLIVKDIKTDKAFERFVKCEVATLAAERIFGRDIKDFKIARANGEKSITIEAEDYKGDPALEVLELESALCEIDKRERFVYLLKTAGELGLIYIGQVIVQREAVARYFYESAIATLSQSKGVNLGLVASVYSQYIAALSVPKSVDEVCKKTIKDRAVFEMPSKRAMTFIITMICVAVLFVVGIVSLVKIMNGDDNGTITSTTQTGTDQSGSGNAAADYDGYIPPEIDKPKTYYADITVRDYGKITVKLDHEAAPMTVANFVNLANNKFYDGLTFHRIMENFMIQGGDPMGTGMGGSENNIFGEFTANGFENKLSHTEGTISMARSSDMNSASSQFFITDADALHLDGQYAAFGKVTEGLDIVKKISADAKPTDSNGTIPASAQPIIDTIVIRAV